VIAGGQFRKKAPPKRCQPGEAVACDDRGIEAFDRIVVTLASRRKPRARAAGAVISPLLSNIYLHPFDLYCD
jgi:hypothetical protein